MANAMATLLCVAIVLSGVALIAQGSFKSMDILAEAWKQMEVTSGDIARTEIGVLGTIDNPPLFDVTLRNSGQTPIRDFPSWDVIVQYYQANGTYHQRWLPYTTTSPPESNRWTVIGIYVDAAGAEPEVYQPDIFNPGEEMVIRVRLAPAANAAAANQLIIGTTNGVTVVTGF